MPEPSPTASGVAPRFAEFVRLGVTHASRLRALVRALLPSRAAVDAVMPESNLAARRKLDRFEPGTKVPA